METLFLIGCAAQARAVQLRRHRRNCQVGRPKLSFTSCVYDPVSILRLVGQRYLIPAEDRRRDLDS